MKHLIEKINGTIISVPLCKEKLSQKIKEIYAKNNQLVAEDEINNRFKIIESINELNLGDLDILSIPQIKINYKLPIQSNKYKVKQFSEEDFNIFGLNHILN